MDVGVVDAVRRLGAGLGRFGQRRLRAGSPHGAGVVRAAVTTCVRGAFVMQRCVTTRPLAARNSCTRHQQVGPA